MDDSSATTEASGLTSDPVTTETLKFVYAKEHYVSMR
jgi:hypothetical protein